MADSSGGPSAPAVPDILHPDARPRMDLEAVERALDFAFASGGGEAVEERLEAASFAPSTWEPRSFARDIFLDELIEQCFTREAPERARSGRGPRRARVLRELFGRPPSDPAVIATRQAVLAELDGSDALRAQLGVVHRELSELVRVLSPSDVFEEIRPRQLGILRAVHRTVVALDEGFETSRSALARLRALGSEIRASAGWRTLEGLLEIEGNLAGLTLQLRVGLDGKIRALELARVTENVDNPHYRSPVRRFLRKLRQWFRGYRFTDDEVLEAVIDAAFDAIKPALARVVSLSPQIEFYVANLTFAELARSRGLEVCLPKLRSAPTALDVKVGADAPRRKFRRLFNPLLLRGALPRSPVPCDLDLGGPSGIAIFTGPNSGGKTRVLQAIAIAQMLGQMGGFVPAERAELVLAESLFVSIIEDASANQREGRLGMELLRIRELFERVRPGGMVMLDELCSGTNPSEGEEMFELVTSLLEELAPQALITTHFLDFARRLGASAPRGATDAPLSFFRVELDADDEPTYGFSPGVAESSLASKTAARLGVTRDELQRLIRRRAGASINDPNRGSKGDTPHPSEAPRSDRRRRTGGSSDR
ncbi:MAG: DNA mismatch repair protein [Polyangiaceae bacterium]